MFNFLKKYEVSDIEYSLLEKITDLENKVYFLENENIELTNCLYELEIKLDSILYKIEEKTYDLTEFALEK
jgi:hypothetical protein